MGRNVGKRTASPGLGSLGRGAVTGAALAVQTGLAAVVGVIVARTFGRTAETDGFFASYGVFAVLVLAATAARVTILPALARARDSRRLGSELSSYALAAAAVVVPLLVVAAAAARPLAALLTGFGPDAARDAASATLPWMVLAAVLQLFAGFAASALAALDDYATAAAGFTVGSVAGLALILLRVDHDGIQAVSWGMALNGALAVAVPAGALARRAYAERVPREAARPGGASLPRRLGELTAGVALPLAMQGIYLVCLPLASSRGVGAVSSFSYAYLIGSAVVAVSASSLSLVTSVPLTRIGVDPARVARHVVASSWIALVAIGAVAGVFALAGERLAADVLGADYESRVGTQLGRLVVVLAVWMAVAVAFSVTFPVLFVESHGPRLPLLAAVVVVAHVGVAFALRAAAGLDGLALALAASTGLAVAGMLALLRALPQTALALGSAACVVAALAALAFGLADLLLSPLPAATVGLVAYLVLLAVVRPRGLRSSWHYLRALA